MKNPSAPPKLRVNHRLCCEACGTAGGARPLVMTVAVVENVRDASVRVDAPPPPLLLFPGGTFVVTLGSSEKSETMTCRLSNNHRSPVCNTSRQKKASMS